MHSCTIMNARVGDVLLFPPCPSSAHSTTWRLLYQADLGGTNHHFLPPETTKLRAFEWKWNGTPVRFPPT